MATAATVSPSAELAAGLADQAHAIESFVRGPCSESCAAFAGAWLALRPLGAVTPQLAAECDALIAQIQRFAQVAAGLERGRYQLAAGQVQPGQYTIGVIKRGAVRSSMAGWLPIIIVGVVAVGVWVLVDLYLEARKLEAAAAVKRAELQQQMTHAIAASPPDQRDQLAAALARANASAAPQDWLTRIGNTLSNAAATAGSAIAGAASSWIPIALALAVIVYMAGGRRGT